MNKKILVVDDLADNREILIIRLEKHGYSCEEANTAEVALSILRERGKNHFSAIFLDWMLPGNMSGLDMFIKMRDFSELDNIPIVLVTARTDDDSHQKAIDNGVKWFLGKPFNHDDLVAIINQIFEKK